MSDLIEKILMETCLDERVSDGIFEISNNSHMEAMRDYLLKKGVSNELVLEFSNLVMEKGKHPEKQAYNVKTGLLITFPTPAYKARAIAAGTHSEQKPTQSNLFGGGQQAPNAAAPQAPLPSAPINGGDGKSELPTSGQPVPPQPTKNLPEPGSSGTPAASAPTTSTNPNQPLAQGQLATEPPKVPVSAAPNVVQPQAIAQPQQTPKTPEEIAATKQIAKQIFNTNDTVVSIPGVGGSGLSEELKKLTKIAIDMNLNESVKFLSNYL